MSNLEPQEAQSEELDLMPTDTKKSRMTKFITVAVVLVLAVAGYFAYQKFKPQESTWLTQTVTQGDLINSVEATGTVVPLREADLNFKSDTVLKSITVEPGSSVAEGQVLAVQDDVDFRSAVEQAQSSYQQTIYKQEQSNMNLEQARRTLEQQTALYKLGSVALSDYETEKDNERTAEINYELAKAQTQAAKSNLASSQENLDNGKLKAPFEGIITVVNGVVGTSTSGSAFAHIISKELKIEAMVNEADIGNVKVGQEVQFTVTTYPDKTFSGTVQRITQQASTTSSVQQYEVDIAVDNSDNLLLSGMSVAAKIIAAKRTDAVLVPMLALTYAQTYIQENPSALGGENTNTPTAKDSTGGNTTSDKSNTQQQRPNWMQRSNSADGTANQGGNWRQNFSGMSGQRQRRNMSGNSGSEASAAAKGSGDFIKRKFVVVLENNKPVVKSIVVGIDDSQNAEVLNGLSAGEKVIIGKYSESTTNNSSTGQNANSNANNGNRSENRSVMRGVGGVGGFSRHMD